MAQLALVVDLANSWRFLNSSQVWSPSGATCIATLPRIALLISLVCIELLSLSARVISVKSADSLVVIVDSWYTCSNIGTHGSDPWYTWGTRVRLIKMLSPQPRGMFQIVYKMQSSFTLRKEGCEKSLSLMMALHQSQDGLMTSWAGTWALEQLGSQGVQLRADWVIAHSEMHRYMYSVHCTLGCFRFALFSKLNNLFHSTTHPSWVHKNQIQNIFVLAQV